MRRITTLTLCCVCMSLPLLSSSPPHHSPYAHPRPLLVSLKFSFSNMSKLQFDKETKVKREREGEPFTWEPLTRQLCFHGGGGVCWGCIMQSCVPNKCVPRLSQMFRFALMVLTAASEICITNVTQELLCVFSPQ